MDDIGHINVLGEDDPGMLWPTLPEPQEPPSHASGPPQLLEPLPAVNWQQIAQASEHVEHDTRTAIESLLRDETYFAGDAAGAAAAAAAGEGAVAAAAAAAAAARARDRPQMPQSRLPMSAGGGMVAAAADPGPVKQRRKATTTAVTGRGQTVTGTWMPEEERLFREGLEEHGHGQWKQIAEMVGTRTRVQVKDYARDFYRRHPEKSPRGPVAPRARAAERRAAAAMSVPPRMRSSRRAAAAAVAAVAAAAPSTDSEDMDEEEDEEEDDAAAAAAVEEEKEMTGVNNVGAEEARRSAFSSGPVGLPDLPQALASDLGLVAGNGASPAQATREVDLDLNVVLPEEREGNPEYFRNHPVKNEARYRRIRDHIVHHWRVQRPQHLTKTAARAGLRDCGDVNAIGKVYEFLDSMGAINFGARRTQGPVGAGTGKRKARDE